MKHVITITAFAVLLAYGSPASAQAPCAARNIVLKVLEEKHKEKLEGTGLASTGQIIELYHSKAGSWTILATNVDGNTCLLATGEGWSVVRAFFDQAL